MRKKRLLALLLSVTMIVSLLPMGAAIADEQMEAIPSTNGENFEQASGSTEGVPLSVFSGRRGEWGEVDHASVAEGGLTLRATSDGEQLFTIVEGAHRDTRNVYYISITGREGGFARLGRPNVHYLVANGWLYEATAAQESNDTPEWFGNTVTRLSRINMEYHNNWTGMRLHLSQIGNPDPTTVNISWQGFDATVRSTTAAHLPANTATLMAVSETFAPLREEGVYYPTEYFGIIMNPLVGGGASATAAHAAGVGQVLGYAYVSWRSLEPVRGELDLSQARIYVWNDYPTDGPNRDQWGPRGALLEPLLQAYANNGRYIQLRMIMDLPTGNRGPNFPEEDRFPHPVNVGQLLSQADQRNFVNLMNRRIADIPTWAIQTMRHESNRPLMANGEPATCPHNIPFEPDRRHMVWDATANEGAGAYVDDGLYDRMRDPSDPDYKFFQAFRDQPLYTGAVSAPVTATVYDGYFRCAIPNPRGGADLRVCPEGCIPYRRPLGLRAYDGGVADFPEVLLWQQGLGWSPDQSWGPEGVWYFSRPAISGGVGLAPRYEHHLLLDYHERLINLLAEAIATPNSPWNSVVQVQLGTLGHWGEWHNWPTQSAGTFPNAEIAYPFVRHYIDAFACNPNVHIGMRYANWIGARYGTGYFHDEAGQTSHFTQINKISQQNLSITDHAGGPGHSEHIGAILPNISENRNANMANVPAFTGIATAAGYNNAVSDPTFWMTRWSGGEYGDTSASVANPAPPRSTVTCDIPRGDLIAGWAQPQFNSVMRAIYSYRWNHVSNLAPRGPIAGRPRPGNATDQRIHKNNDAMFDNMGYRFVVEEVSVDGILYNGETVDVRMVVNNRGVAPFHRDWPFEVSFINEAGDVVDAVVIDDVNINEWMPRHRAFSNARPPMTSYRYVEGLDGTPVRVYYRPGAEQAAQGTRLIPAFDGRNVVEFELDIPANLPEGSHTLAIAILDPILRDNNPGIRFHNVGARADWRLPLTAFVTGEPGETRGWSASVVGEGVLVSTSGNVAPGALVTLTLSPRAGYELTAIEVAGAGINQESVTRNLVNRTITFVMPDGEETLAVTVTPTWVEVFDPGAYSLRLIGNGEISSERFTPHQSVNFPLGTFEFSVWIKGDVEDLSIRAEGAMGNLHFVTRSAVSYNEWTQITSTVVCDEPGWRTFVITAGDSDDNHVYLTNFSLINPAGNNVLQNPELATGNFNGWHLTADWAVNWVGTPGNPGNNWAVVSNEIVVPTYTVTRAVASTVPAANMAITPEGAQEVGTTMTVTITPPTGQQIVDNSLSVTGVPNITLTANGATFPMPAGGGEIVVNAQFAYPPDPFDPGAFSMRLQGDGAGGFSLNQQGMAQVPGTQVSLSIWVRGIADNLTVRFSGGGYAVMLDRAINYANWTQITTTVPSGGGGWGTLIVEGTNAAPNELLIASIEIEGWNVRNSDFANGFEHWNSFEWAGNPLAPGSGWSVVPNVVTAPTYTVTRAAASTVPVANMTITPAGAQEVGTTMTVTITPPVGQQIVDNSLSITGVPNITLTANGATFPMPAGGGEITVNAQFAYPPDPFNPGDYSLRLQGDGNSVFRPHQSVRRSTVAGEEITISFWAKGTGNLRMHIYGPPNVDLFNGPVDFEEWTLVTNTVTIPSAGWVTFVIQGSTIGDNAVYIDDLAFTSTATGVFLGPLDNLDFERHGLNGFGNGTFGSGHWFRPDFDWIGSPPETTYRGGAWTIVSHTAVATYAVTRNPASTVPATNMAITPEGYHEVGTLMTVTVTPPLGQQIAAGSLTVAGVPNVTLTANGATFPMPAGGGAITVNAEFEPRVITVTFNPNGGIVNPTSRTVTVGATFGGAFPMPARPGYTFEGWFTAPVGGTRILGTNIVTHTADLTLYARWRQGGTIVITFNPNSGTTTEAYRTVTTGDPNHGGAFRMPVRPGYIFEGWFTAPVGGTRIIGTHRVTLTSNTTLFAQWRPDNYIVVTFNPTGGTVTPASRNVIHGQDFGGAFPRPSRLGYVFEGWFTAPTGGQRIFGTQPVAHISNFTLYARWSPSDTIVVTFNPAGGFVNPTSRTVTVGDTFGAAFPMPTRPGHIFEGWFTAETGGARIQGGHTVTQRDNFTLFARWRVDNTGFTTIETQ